ncbi:hypothetical protein HKX48_005653, partial [Thoreauomyces humboldtii]
MNVLTRLAPAARLGQRRAMSSTPAKSSLPPHEQVMLKDAYEARQHAEAAVSSWKKINLFLVVPALALVTWYSGPKELAHIAHLKEHAQEFQPLPYMRKRKN